mgnify:CR=1 FL=1
MTIEVIAGEDGGLIVHDHIERRRCELLTESPVEPAEVDTGGFNFPVDVAVAIETDTVRLPHDINTLVRTVDGEILAAVDILEHHEFDEGVYFVEMSAAVKLYLRVEGPVSVGSVETEPSDKVIQGVIRSPDQATGHPKRVDFLVRDRAGCVNIQERTIEVDVVSNQNGVPRKLQQFSEHGRGRGGIPHVRG